MEQNHEVVIIGAGVAGLTCARTLSKAGRDVLIVESSSTIGGRLKTDIVDGFRLDRGFQVLQSAYPEAQSLLDYEELELKAFPAGARIRFDGQFHIVADPWRKPSHFFSTLVFPIGSLADRIKLIGLVREVCSMDIEDIFRGEERLAYDYLETYGFSQEFIEHFFKPFLAGVCLDPEIRVTQRFLLFVLRMFAQGDAAIPAHGMHEIPRQLARDLAPGSFLFNNRVQRIGEDHVVLADGMKIMAETIVLATPEHETTRLLGRPAPRSIAQEYCLYFSADAPPVSDPFLTLNGEGKGLINSVTFPSLVSPEYAPAGKVLVAAVVPGFHGLTMHEIEGAVRQELTGWFGSQVESWRNLKNYHVHNALPIPKIPSNNPYTFNPRVDKNLFTCSELESLPAIQWALYSGERAAHAVANYLDAMDPAFC